MSTLSPDISFIFFLILEDELPESFYLLDRNLKPLGFMLLPLRLDQLQLALSAAEQKDALVLCSVTNFSEYRTFVKTTRKFLKYLLKSRNITFMMLSSFSALNDSKSYKLQGNYFFMKYPIDASALCPKIARYHELKVTAGSSKWPGGKRAGVRGISV